MGVSNLSSALECLTQEGGLLQCRRHCQCQMMGPVSVLGGHPAYLSGTRTENRTASPPGAAKICWHAAVLLSAELCGGVAQIWREVQLARGDQASRAFCGTARELQVTHTYKRHIVFLSVRRTDATPPIVWTLISLSRGPQHCMHLLSKNHV